MKRTIPTLVLLLATAAPALSQQFPPGPLTGRVEESTGPTPVDSRPLTTVEPGEHHACRLRRLGHGLAQAMRFTGRVTEQALATAIQAAANGAEAYYASVPAYGGYAGTYAATLSATAATEDMGSCYHGYTYATCPYGYNGNSYGTPYISGAGPTRLQSDYMGGYRFYNTNGAAGVARPDLMGGYRVSTLSGGTNYNLYTASHVAYPGGGYRRW